MKNKCFYENFNLLFFKCKLQHTLNLFSVTISNSW